MQIQYHNTLDHLVALQKYVLRHSEFGKRMMLHRFIAVEIIIVFIAILFAVNHNPFNVFLGLVIVSGLAWLFRERSVLLQFKRDFKRERRKDKTGLFDLPRTLAIGPEGITAKIGPNDNRHGWHEVSTSGRDSKYIYIVLTGVLHYVVPLASFADRTEADRFMAMIEQYRNA